MLKPLLPLVEIQDACAGYGQTPVLRSLSLELRAGELLGLLGPNGAGKTTLINCIAGRRSLDRGRIRFSDARDRAEFLGIVPQSIAVYPDPQRAAESACFRTLAWFAWRDAAEKS